MTLIWHGGDHQSGWSECFRNCCFFHITISGVYRGCQYSEEMSYSFYIKVLVGNARSLTKDIFILVLYRAHIDWKFSVPMRPVFFFFFFDKYGFFHSPRIISREMFPHSDNILFLGDFNICVCCPIGPLSLDLFMSWAVFDLVLSLVYLSISA